ncbi:XkdX family protein [Halalkalibacterium ligniniphilum]|nr:XkdX family protein [Halalkalibacterium ligniniphilum]
MFARIKRFYDNNLWTKEQVYNAVGAGAITVEEYEQITGEVYPD